MKVAVLGESSADEAFVHLIVESVLRRQIELVQPRLRSRGWPSVRDVLPSIYKGLVYQTNVDGLVVVVDSNGTAVHREHTGQRSLASCDTSCRLCELRARIAQVRQSLSKSSRSLFTAIGLAVPAIEAWLLCGEDPHVTEAAWVNGLRENRLPYTRPELKQRAYGTDRPSLEQETAAARAAAARLARDTAPLTQCFPQGFGALWRDLEAWRTQV